MSWWQSWRVPGMWRELWFETHLSVDECRIRLLEELDPQILKLTQPRRECFGDLTEDGFWAWLPTWLTSWSPYVIGEFDSGPKTVIRARFGLHPFVRVFIYSLSAVGVFSLGWGVVAALAGADAWRQFVDVFGDGLFLFLVVPATGLLLAHLSRSHQQRLVEFIRLTVKATVLESSPGFESFKSSEPSEPYVKPRPQRAQPATGGVGQV